MADYSPKFKPGQDITLTASAAIVGGNLVAVSGPNTVAPAGANVANYLGVARQDAAIGDRVVVTRGTAVQKLIASGAVTAGDRVSTAAAGKVATSATAPIGTALTTAADGAVVLVAMDR